MDSCAQNDLDRVWMHSGRVLKRCGFGWKHWLIVLYCGGVYSMFIMQTSLPSTTSRSLAAKFTEFSATGYSWNAIFGAQSVGQLFASVPLGLLLDRCGRRHVIMSLFLASIFVSLCSTWIQTTEVYIVSRMLIIFVSAPSSLMSCVLAVECVSASDTAFVFFVGQCVCTIISILVFAPTMSRQLPNGQFTKTFLHHPSDPKTWLHVQRYCNIPMVLCALLGLFVYVESPGWMLYRRRPRKEVWQTFEFLNNSRRPLQTTLRVSHLDRIAFKHLDDVDPLTLKHAGIFCACPPRAPKLIGNDLPAKCRFGMYKTLRNAHLTFWGYRQSSTALPASTEQPQLPSASQLASSVSAYRFQHKASSDVTLSSLPTEETQSMSLRIAIEPPGPQSSPRRASYVEIEDSINGDLRVHAENVYRFFTSEEDICVEEPNCNNPTTPPPTPPSTRGLTRPKRSIDLPALTLPIPAAATQSVAAASDSMTSSRDSLGSICETTFLSSTGRAADEIPLPNEEYGPTSFEDRDAKDYSPPCDASQRRTAVMALRGRLNSHVAWQETSSVTMQPPYCMHLPANMTWLWPWFIITRPPWAEITGPIVLIWFLGAWSYWGLLTYFEQFFAEIGVDVCLVILISYAVQLPFHLVCYEIMKAPWGGRKTALRITALTGSILSAVLAFACGSGTTNTLCISVFTVLSVSLGTAMWGPLLSWTAERYPCEVRGTVIGVCSAVSALSILGTTYVGAVSAASNSIWLMPLFWALTRFGVYAATYQLDYEILDTSFSDERSHCYYFY